ncbi:MAG: dTDP-4-dehydrorhamnose 3,5-epimerase [Chloroflexota bacterium]|nr:dTDP-4-dehydrorhamnose 3,5-epimerase [Chloroflexota bacterium]
MEVRRTPLDGVLVLKPTVHVDIRGFFMESYSARTLQSLGIDVQFVQDNHSRSMKGVLRGLHYQVNPGQVKLVRAISGAIFDVAVDIRHGSPTFGRWFGQVLSEDNFLQLYMPPGFAHGFCVLSERADIAYKVNTFYSPPDERGLRWDDPEIGIDWPVSDPLVSERDRHHPALADIKAELVYQP